jgi:hypothetical protein
VNEVIQQTIGRSAENVSWVTAITGGATVLEIIPPVAGAIASILGVIFAAVLFVKKNKLLDLQIKSIKEEDE